MKSEQWKTIYYVWRSNKGDWDFVYQGSDLKKAEEEISFLLKAGLQKMKSWFEKKNPFHGNW